jgi:hypothetical protein
MKDKMAATDPVLWTSEQVLHHLGVKLPDGAIGAHVNGGRPPPVSQEESTVNENQSAAVPVTDRLLETWSVIADTYEPRMRLGEVNWVMMVRSLIAEVHNLRRVEPR